MLWPWLSLCLNLKIPGFSKARCHARVFSLPSSSMLFLTSHNSPEPSGLSSSFPSPGSSQDGWLASSLPSACKGQHSVCHVTEAAFSRQTLNSQGWAATAHPLSLHPWPPCLWWCGKHSGGSVDTVWISTLVDGWNYVNVCVCVSTHVSICRWTCCTSGLILGISRKCHWARRSTSWNQDCWEK